MKIQQRYWSRPQGWLLTRPHPRALQETYELVLAFGDFSVDSGNLRFQELRDLYPAACIVSCSSAGEILDDTVREHTIAASAIAFDSAHFRTVSVNIAECAGSREAGARLITGLPQEELVHVLLFSDAQHVKGTDLMEGILGSLVRPVSITGGLAGDGTRFARTVVGVDAPPSEGTIVAIGFYGAALRVGHGSADGWDPFGPERRITRAEGNVLYELDGRPALDLYRHYLGDLAADLPRSALLFPLSVRSEEENTRSVRTITSIDTAAGTMTFAANMPQNGSARLMKANFDRLISAASMAAWSSREALGSAEPELALLTSCVGRRVVLGHRVEEEVEAVHEVVGKETAIAGFYSYGEIASPCNAFRCEIHSQTMTVTTFSERADV